MNLGDVVSEFAGVASSMDLFGISQVHSRHFPLALGTVWALMVYGDYKRLEKILLLLSFLYVPTLLRL